MMNRGSEMLSSLSMLRSLTPSLSLVLPPCSCFPKPHSPSLCSRTQGHQVKGNKLSVTVSADGFSFNLTFARKPPFHGHLCGHLHSFLCLECQTCLWSEENFLGGNDCSKLTLQISSKIHRIHVFASKELSAGCGKALDWSPGGWLLFPLTLKIWGLMLLTACLWASVSPYETWSFDLWNFCNSV